MVLTSTPEKERLQELSGEKKKKAKEPKGKQIPAKKRLVEENIIDSEPEEEAVSMAMIVLIL